MDKIEMLANQGKLSICRIGGEWLVEILLKDTDGFFTNRKVTRAETLNNAIENI